MKTVLCGLFIAPIRILLLVPTIISLIITAKIAVIRIDKDKPSSWAKEAWEWAKKEGITDGTNPKDPITREQVVTMLYRFAKKVK